MDRQGIRAAGLCSLWLLLSTPALAETGGEKACPTNPDEAARQLWPRANALAMQANKLTAKHPCGRFVQCKRSYPLPTWRCQWKTRQSAGF
ncbi:hypothetical protein [uncultured Cohaesibacter sp.]|uniref:hypothetical protein n=1 Tax=uncultured Cohaesibacter sp. TaxID=1002546 RepID=UPI002931A927|nr:hypothetical protein [uncultured Cohaesibacter sp.]